MELDSIQIAVFLNLTGLIAAMNGHLHNIHLMVITLSSGVVLALLLTTVFGKRPILDAHTVFSSEATKIG